MVLCRYRSFIRDQPAVGDGNPMGIAGEVGKYGVRSGEGAFGIDDPVDLAQRLQPITEGRRLGKCLMLTKELQFTCTVGVIELLKVRFCATTFGQ